MTGSTMRRGWATMRMSETARDGRPNELEMDANLRLGGRDQIYSGPKRDRWRWRG